MSSTDGEWTAGRNGARPRIVMPGTILVGGKYYEEISSEDQAPDKGEILCIQCGCEAGGTSFSRPCVTIAGSNDCDSHTDQKVYVKGISTVVDDDLEISNRGFVDDEG